MANWLCLSMFSFLKKNPLLLLQTKPSNYEQSINCKVICLTQQTDWGHVFFTSGLYQGVSCLLHLCYSQNNGKVASCLIFAMEVHTNKLTLLGTLRQLLYIPFGGEVCFTVVQSSQNLWQHSITLSYSDRDVNCLILLNGLVTLNYNNNVIVNIANCFTAAHFSWNAKCTALFVTAGWNGRHWSSRPSNCDQCSWGMKD